MERLFNREPDDSECEEIFINALADFGDMVLANSKAHGFWPVGQNESEKIALIHSELSEALEALRDTDTKMDKHCPEFTNLEIEMADAVIRIMDFCAYKGIRLGEAVIAKHNFNKTRPVKHGRKF